MRSKDSEPMVIHSDLSLSRRRAVSHFNRALRRGQIEFVIRGRMRTNRKFRSETRAVLSVVIAASLTAGAALNACGNDSFSPASAQDASSEATANDSAADVFIPPPADAGVCNLSLPFKPPVPIAELNSAENNEQTARLTHDELTMYFQAQQIPAPSDAGDAGDGGSDASVAVNSPPIVIMMSTRGSIADTWGTAVALPVPVNGSGNNSDPSVTADNQTLYFTSDRVIGSSGLSDIWTVQNSGGTFGTANDVKSIDTAVEDSQPYIMPDGLTIYYRSRGKALDFLKLYRATRTASGTTFTVDTSGLFNVVNVNTNIQELPTVPPDELSVYYTSNALEGGSARDIWKATRSTTSDPFGNPAPVDELNTTASDEASWISDDGCRIYISSSINGTSDLFVASKPAK
jgi:hypothetical protein